MQFSSILFISSTLLSSAFANPMFEPYTAPPTEHYSPEQHPAAYSPEQHPAAYSPERHPAAYSPEEHPYSPEEHVPHPHLPQPHFPHPHLPEPHFPHPHLPEPHFPHPHLPEPHVPHPHFPKPHVPHPPKTHRYPFDTVAGYECRDSRSDCRWMGPDHEGKIRSCEDQYQMVHIKREDIGVDVVEVSFASTPSPYTPDSDYRIRCDSYGRLVYGTEGEIVYFKKTHGAQNTSLHPYDATKQIRWCGAGNTVGDGYHKSFSYVDRDSPVDPNCEVIHTFRQSAY